MLPAGAHRSHRPNVEALAVFGVLGLVLALRLLHLSSALQSPLSYQPGPDEDYYQRFGAAVASGHGADSPEFTFMDPGYGYLLGAVFKLTGGVNVFAVYLLQALLDAAAAYGILVAGRALGRARAGFYGALLYGLTSTAIMFCATLLKETCVAAYLIGWVAGALAVSRSDRRLAWAAFGVYCGLGAALRSTLFLLFLPALLLPTMLGWITGRNGSAESRSSPPRAATAWISKSLLLCLGIALSLAPWSIRNFRAVGSLSPFPHNGGIVLHQIYNADNPQSTIWIPPFVDYSNPSEIWRGYAAEANRRTGRLLSPSEVDRYWRDQALAFMRAHPGQVLEDVAHKSLMFFADTEVPNNRSSDEERLFSPLLALLPRPMAWLLGMGLAGLAGFALQDRRWPLLAAPIALSAVTFVLFWAEDRFRFHAAPVLALCSGLWLDGLIGAARSLRERPARRSWQPAALVLLAVLISSNSWSLGSRFPAPPLRWDHVVWGYIRMGKLAEARSVAEQVVKDQPDNAPVLEALGYLSAAERRYTAAAQNFERAIALRPRSYVAHYNLAKAYQALGDRAKAADEARAAMSLNPTRDASALLEQLQAAP